MGSSDWVRETKKHEIYATTFGHGLVPFAPHESDTDGNTIKFYGIFSQMKIANVCGLANKAKRINKSYTKSISRSQNFESRGPGS